MTLARKERKELGNLLLDKGPEAPTCCEGWNTRSLAVHLLLRENNPVALAGLFVAPLEKYHGDKTDQLLRRNYQDVVKEWMTGAPVWNPLRYIDKQANTAEYFVHHEDVRRAEEGWQPRSLRTQDLSELYQALKFIAPVMLKKSSKPVIVQPDGFDRIVCADRSTVAAKGNDVVRIAGPVPEILLYCYGRPTTDLIFDGDTSAIDIRKI
ncbi:TIGR03085 family metal-binding protein [Corynebacterium mendelii]|uniref:TIGR03085 family protein n=1 Tax=Corynebacterium mendelii TaxID=2765362 RepID=A0A939DZW2_9CORY|nr:TIGR03085 family metal-binding protein [Corynebacterium mendelii]MBN9643293.1 TIGR03085 family protein [Corynebacterium mendelii]